MTAPEFDRARALGALLRGVSVEPPLFGACMMAASEYVRGTEDIELAVDLQLPDLKELAERIMSLSHSIGMKVVADGVETAAQRDILLGHGCDFGQGWLFGCPIRQAPI